MEVGGQRHAPASLPLESPGTHCVRGWVDLISGLDGCGKFRLPTGIRSPDRPASSETLYRLKYPGPKDLNYMTADSYHDFIKQDATGG